MANTEYDLYQSHVQKLKDFCKSAELRFTLDCGNYPMTLMIRPDEDYHQMSLLEVQPEERINASMIFTLADGEIRFTTVGGFVINDATFSKIKGLFQKISSFWLQYVFHWQTLREDEHFRALCDKVRERSES